jgi:hypothetical protein
MAPSDDDFQWLSEQVDDEEIAALFTDDEESLKLAVRHLIARAREDLVLERALIDTLDLAIEESCDDVEAAPWIAVILGELGSPSALGALSRAIYQEDDELLQDAASVALSRIGPEAVAYLIDEFDDRGISFQRAAYRVLGDAGVLEDDAVLRRVRDFLEDRFPIEANAGAAESSIEEIADAAARIGHRGLLEPIREALVSRFSGHHPILEDAIERLEENAAGLPFVPTIKPWEDRYGWLYEDSAENARVRRDRPLSLGGADLDPLAGFSENPFATPDDDDR